MCFLEKMPKEIYSSHNFGDKACKSISNQDKAKLSNGRFSSFKEESNYEDDEELAEMFG